MNTKQIICNSNDPELTAYIVGSIGITCGLVDGLSRKTYKDIIQYLDAAIAEVEQPNKKWILQQFKIYVEMQQ